jgi:hypothetical protein
LGILLQSFATAMFTLWTVFQVWILLCGQEVLHPGMCACADAKLFILNLACMLLSRALCW